MLDFFLFARLNLLNVLICIAKKNLRERFSFPVFDVPKASNFTSGGVQSCGTKNMRLGMIVTSFQDFKLSEKQISLTFSHCELISSLRNGTIVRYSYSLVKERVTVTLPIRPLLCHHVFS